MSSLIGRIKRRLARLAGMTAATTGSADYWTGYNVTTHHRFGSAAESLEYFHWRNDQYPGYIDLMPVAGQDGKVVLDYGCGPGHDVIGFGIFSRPAKLVAADVSPTSLAEARERAQLHGLEVDFLQIDERDNKLPLESGSVDYIHSSGVIHHTTDPVKVLRELKRVLSSSGRMRVMVYNYESVWLHLYAAYVLGIARGAYPGLAVREVFSRTTDGEDCPISRIYTPEEFGALAARAGLACRFLGAAVSLFELKLLPQRFDAIADRRLGAEHRQFLLDLEIDRRGRPVHRGSCAGVDGCYELTHADGIAPSPRDADRTP